MEPETGNPAAPVTTREEVLRRLESKAESIRRQGVRRLGLFGSFARNEAKPESDVDILVEFQPGAKTFRSFMRTAFLLEDLLGRDVELVTEESFSLYLRDRIVRSAVYVEL
jgi:predicted nucleotidyltransferase